MSKLLTPEQKMKLYRTRLRKAGLRPIQIWVPDIRSPAIVKELRLKRRFGRRWTISGLVRVVSHPIYLGTYVYNRTTQRLKSRSRLNPADHWVVVPGAVETIIPREMLYIADEVFFTGTAAEITPIRSVDKITVNKGAVGPVTKEIRKEFFGVIEGRIDDKYGWLTPVALRSRKNEAVTV